MFSAAMSSGDVTDSYFYEKLFLLSLVSEGCGVNNTSNNAATKIMKSSPLFDTMCLLVLSLMLSSTVI